MSGRLTGVPGSCPIVERVFQGRCTRHDRRARGHDRPSPRGGRSWSARVQHSPTSGRRVASGSTATATTRTTTRAWCSTTSTTTAAAARPSHQFHDGSCRTQDHPARRPGAAEPAVRRTRRMSAAAQPMPDHDVVVVGGGGAGLRAAIAIVQAEPAAERGDRVEGLPDAQPHGLGRGRRGGGHRDRRQPGRARLRHGVRQRLALRPGRGRGIRRGGTARAAPAGALGLPVEPHARRADRGPRVRRHEEDAHLVRGGQDRIPPAAHACSRPRCSTSRSPATTSGT